MLWDCLLYTSSGQPIYCIVDDTIASHTRPSSQAVHPIEAAYFHQSHLKGNQDKGLQGNEKIEQAIVALQQEATQEMLAHTLTVIRRRMREKGQFILSVEPVSYTHLWMNRLQDWIRKKG